MIAFFSLLPLVLTDCLLTISPPIPNCSSSSNSFCSSLSLNKSSLLKVPAAYKLKKSAIFTVELDNSPLCLSKDSLLILLNSSAFKTSYSFVLLYYHALNWKTIHCSLMF